MPGIHHVIVLMDAEDTVDHMFSQTVWTLGPPRWYDGNDVADMTPAQLAALRSTGLAPLRRMVTPYAGRLADRVIGNQRQVYAQKLDTATIAHILKGIAIAVTLPVP
jgi:hypothetical protein